jgi:hypothetical protein
VSRAKSAYSESQCQAAPLDVAASLGRFKGHPDGEPLREPPFNQSRDEYHNIQGRLAQTPTQGVFVAFRKALHYRLDPDRNVHGDFVHRQRFVVTRH